MTPPQAQASGLMAAERRGAGREQTDTQRHKRGRGVAAVYPLLPWSIGDSSLFHCRMLNLRNGTCGGVGGVWR